MKKIAVVSQKGGTGKTATAINLGYELAQEGVQVLLVDFDPQANLTSGLGVNPYESRLTVYDAMKNPSDGMAIEIADNLSLLPANLDLAGAEIELTADQFMDRNGWLRGALVRQTRYDYILIDCPPSLGFFTANALFASDEILVPMQVEPYSLAAMRQLVSIVEKVRMRHYVGWAGIVLTMYDRRIGLTEAVEEEARGRFGDLVFDTTIPRNVAIAEASAVGQPVAMYDKYSSGAKAYKALAQEVING